MSSNKMKAAAAQHPRLETDQKGAKRLPSTQKGRDKRDKIKIVTSDLLGSLSYHELTLERITSAVGMPISVFYHYFPGKRQLVLELLDEMFKGFSRRVLAARPFGRFENAVMKVNRELLTLFSENVGLMRCVNEVEEPGFASRWREHLGELRAAVAVGLSEYTDLAAPDPHELLAITHAAGGMIEGIAYERCVLKTEALCTAFPDLDSAAAFMTMLYVRAVFATNPANVRATQFPTLSSLHELGR